MKKKKESKPSDDVSNFHVRLGDLAAWARTEAERLGFSSVPEFLRDLVRQAKQASAQ